MANTWTLSADWIITMAGPPIAGGLIRIEKEKIVCLEARRSEKPDVDLAGTAILPGFVNAHTHLDLTKMRGQCQPDLPLTGWLAKVISGRQKQTAQSISESIRNGLQEVQRTGTTAVGDISPLGHSWEQLAASPVHGVCFYELVGMSAEKANASWKGWQTFSTNHQEDASVRLGISPHAPYSVNDSLFRLVANQTSHMPVAIHLAESPEELELLQHHNGPFVDLLKSIGVWNPSGMLKSLNDLMAMFRQRRVLYVHCNYLPQDLRLPDTATIIYCPRTHHAFGHSKYPLQSYLSRSIRVALGTDSLASNPDLSMLNEVRFLWQQEPAITAENLLAMATINGATSLGLDSLTGSLEPGKCADLIALPLSSKERPLEDILNSRQDVVRVLNRGHWVV